MIFVAGSANLDFVVRAERIPVPGETVLGHDFKTCPGGKGANQALACARAGGATTHMLLALGQDAFALPLQASLSEAGVHLHTVFVDDLATGTAFICVREDGQNAITVAPGANFCLSEEHLPSLAGFSHLLMQLEIPMDTVLAYARSAHAQGVKVVLNAAPAQVLPSELLKLLDVLVVNEGELAQLSGAGSDLLECMARIEVPCVVVTLGERGCVALSGQGTTWQSGFNVDCVDSTGAGDTFCGVLVAALGRGDDLAQALRLASAAGALACTRAGAQTGVPSLAEVTGFLDTH